jgi:hypothetical protein
MEYPELKNHLILPSLEQKVYMYLTTLLEVVLCINFLYNIFINISVCLMKKEKPTPNYSRFVLEVDEALLLGDW